MIQNSHRALPLLRLLLKCSLILSEALKSTNLLRWGLWAAQAFHPPLGTGTHLRNPSTWLLESGLIVQEMGSMGHMKPWMPERSFQQEDSLL